MKKISTDDSILLWKKRSEYATDDFSKVLWPDRPLWNKYYDEWQLHYLSPYISMIGREDTVLDVGCGIGRWTLRIAPVCKVVYGIDSSEKNIELAKGKAKLHNLNNTVFQVVDVRDLNDKFRTNYFDFIFSVATLCFITNVGEFKEAIRGLINTLKKGGYFILLENTIKGENYISISIHDWLYIINQEGGEIIEVYGIDNPILREIFVNIPFYRFTKLTTRRSWKLNKENIVKQDISLTKLYNQMNKRNKSIEDSFMKFLVKVLKPFEFTIPKVFKALKLIKKSNYYIIIVRKKSV